jgi:hypothetical protein
MNELHFFGWLTPYSGTAIAVSLSLRRTTARLTDGDNLFGEMNYGSFGNNAKRQ